MRARELFETPYPEWYAAGTVVDITSDRYEVAEYLEGDEFNYEYRLCMVPASLIIDPDFAPIPTHSETGEERTASITTWANGNFTRALLENPPIVLWSGRFHNIDGYHRVNLAAQAGLSTIPVIVGMRSPLTETSTGLFEHQISNPTEVRKYVATAVGQVTNADAAKWLHVALSRHINNSDTNFLVPFSKKMSDYLDDEVKPHMATIKDLRTFVSPDILRTTEYELVDDYDTEETIGILEQQTRDVTAWLNAGGKYQGLPFNIAAKRAGAWVRDEVLRSGLNDVTPVLELGNGWRWVRLNSEAAARAEGYAMKNCLRHDIKKFHTADHANPLYSLRDRKNMPHVNYGGDGEPFGIANSDVKQQYLPAIEALEEYLENPKPLWGSEETATQKRSREATEAEAFLTQMNIGGRGEVSENYVQVSGRFADDVDIKVKVWIDPSARKLRKLIEKSRWGVLKGIIARLEDKPVVLVWDAQDAFHDAVMTLGKIKHEITPDRRQGGGGFVIAKNEEIMKSDEDWGYRPEMHKVDVAQDGVCVMNFAARALTQYPAFVTMMGPLKPSPKFKRRPLSESDTRKHWKFWINVKTGQWLDCRDGGEFNDHCGYALAHQEQFGHDLKSLLPEREVERIIAGKSYSGASSGTIFDRVCPEGWVRVYYGSRLRTLALEGENIRMLAKAIRIFSKRFPDIRRLDMDTRSPFEQRYANGIRHPTLHRSMEGADIDYFIQKGIPPSY